MQPFCTLRTNWFERMTSALFKENVWMTKDLFVEHFLFSDLFEKGISSTNGIFVHNRMSMNRVPGHSGVSGNKRPDDLGIRGSVWELLGPEAIKVISARRQSVDRKISSQSEIEMSESGDKRD